MDPNTNQNSTNPGTTQTSTPPQPIMTTPPPQMNSPMTSGAPSLNQPKRSSIGAIIGIIIILALLVIAALFFWGRSQLKETAIPTIPNATGNTQSQDDLSSIEADLNSLNLDNTSEIDALGR